jgi:hypothetical protein
VKNQNMYSESTNIDAREVPFSDAKQAALSLAECFTDDVVARYYLQISDCDRPLTPKEKRLNLRIYECLTAAHCIKGLVVSAGPSHDSVGLWLPPDSDWNLKTYWKSKMWLLWLKLGREGRKRFFGSWDTLEEGMTSIMGARASITWILTDLGTIKSSRRQGYATKVVEYGLKLVSSHSSARSEEIHHAPESDLVIFRTPMLFHVYRICLTSTQADAQHQPTYLECCDYNVLFYEKFGFRKVSKLSLDRAAEPIVLQTMVREPIAI